MFDPSAPHIIILLVVVLLLFGSSRLPGAAKALGKSMHIFRRSVKGEEEADQPTAETRVTQVTTALPPAGPAAAAPTATQQELQDIQRRLEELQRKTSGDDSTVVSGAPLSEAQRDQRPS